MATTAARSATRSSDPTPNFSVIDLDPTLHSLANSNEAGVSDDTNPLADFAQHVLGQRADGGEPVFFDENAAFEILGGVTEEHDEVGELGNEVTMEEDRDDRRAGRRRKFADVDGDGDPVRNKKDSHKEVERRRRENINDGINDIARLIPGGSDKMGKGTLLKRAAEHLSEVSEQAKRATEELSKRDQEKQDLVNELARTQTRLTDEHNRCIRFESTWREAEDRAAASQFELERVKTELEQLKKRVS